MSAIGSAPPTHRCWSSPRRRRERAPELLLVSNNRKVAGRAAPRPGPTARSPRQTSGARHRSSSARYTSATVCLARAPPRARRRRHPWRDRAGDLQRIRARIRAHTRDDDYRLADYFDYIGGTAQAAIVAAALALDEDRGLRRAVPGAHRHIFTKHSLLHRYPGPYPRATLKHQLENILGTRNKHSGDPIDLLIVVLHNTRTDSTVADCPTTHWLVRAKPCCSSDESEPRSRLPGWLTAAAARSTSPRRTLASAHGDRLPGRRCTRSTTLVPAVPDGDAPCVQPRLRPRTDDLPRGLSGHRHSAPRVPVSRREEGRHVARSCGGVHERRVGEPGPALGHRGVPVSVHRSNNQEFDRVAEPRADEPSFSCMRCSADMSDEALTTLSASAASRMPTRLRGSTPRTTSTMRKVATAAAHVDILSGLRHFLRTGVDDRGVRRGRSGVAVPST